MPYVPGQDLLSYALGSNAVGHAEPGRGRAQRNTRELRPARISDRPEPGQRPAAPMKDPERLRDVLRQVAAAMCALHAAGKLHRDLKPDNVLVTTEGRAVVLDFGIAAERHVDAHGTMEAGVMGTPAYMSPEQARSSPISEATDWYAFGVMLFECLTGRLPFDGPYEQVLQLKQLIDPPAPGALVTGVPDDLDALCVRLLARDPLRRPTGAEVLAALGSPSGAASCSTKPSMDPGSTFVGRKHELAELERALGASDEGSPVLLFVHGSTGMGKTALVERFLEELPARDTVVFSGRCYEHERVPLKALDSVVDALSRYLGRLSPTEASEVLPKDIHALAQLFPVLRRVDVVLGARRRGALAPEPRMQRQQALAALKELLARIANRQRLVVFIDDLQWGDIDSARVLAELVIGRDRPALLIVCTYRSADKESSPCLSTLLELMRGKNHGTVRELNVGPMPERECAELAGLLLHERARGEAAAVARESRGNPYLLAQLVDHVHAETEAQSGIRVSLEHTLSDRFAHLSDDAARVLELAAISGRPLREQVLSELADGQLDRAGAIAELRRAKLVRGIGAEDGRAIAIYHESLRSAVLARLSPSAIEELHRRLASAIERKAPVDLEALIEHLLGSGDHARAGIYAISAARKAFDAFAFNKAAELYAIAVEHQEDDAWRRDLQLALAEALACAGRNTRAAELYLHVAEHAPQGDASRLRTKAGTQLMLARSFERGIEVMTQPLAELGISLPQDDEHSRALAKPLIQELRARGFDFVPRGESDIPAETKARLDLLWGALQATVTNRPSFAHSFAARYLLEALAAGEKTRIVVALGAYFINVDLVVSSASGAKPKSLQQAEALCRDVSDPRCRAWLAFARAFAFMHEGLLKPACLDFAQAEDLFRNHCQNAAPELRVCRMMHGRALALMGQLDELGICEQWIRDALECEDLLLATRLRLYMTPRLLLEGDVQQAASALDVPESLLAQGTMTTLLMLLSSVQIALYRGDAPELDRLALELRKVKPSPMLIVRTWRSDLELGRARALLGGHRSAANREAALASAERRIASVEKIGLECHSDHARLLRAALLHARGEDEGARAAIDVILRDGDTGGEGRLVLACARIRRGQLEGGERGAALAFEGQHELANRGVREPLKFARLYAPGFDALERGPG